MAISALDESGNAVDWWFIYKVPKLDAGSGTDAATGYEYVYYDSKIDVAPNLQDQKVLKSPYVLNSNQGALNLTLDSVFKDYNNRLPNVGWILYNDEMPVSVGHHDDGTKGHSKGVIAFDTATDSAYWLLHSWPKFLDPDATTDPTPQYGQTYLCISLDLDTANQIAQLMLTHQEPQLYDQYLADIPQASGLYLLTQGQAPTPKPLAGSIELKSKAGMDFTVIAKNREWNNDFWDALVGPLLNDDMDDETWIRGKIPPIADSDGIHKTFDIKYINLGPLGAHWAWPETHDHAKWGITLHKPWICVADINRMISQRKRGGGTIAFQNQTLWSALSKTSLVLAPPGYTRTQANKLLKNTKSPHHEAPPKVQPSP